MAYLNSDKTSYNTIYKETALRFAFIFFVLFIVFLDFYSNIFTDILYDIAHLDKLSDKAIYWVGNHLFKVPYYIIKPVVGDHSDSTYIYLLYFTMLSVAGSGAVLWSALDRKRTNHDKLYYWLTVIVRYYLAFTLFAFALEKFYKAQFADLSYYRLSQTLGDMSPMGFAYAFFGYSTGYNIFMGVAECAALLLLFRRTMTFGALLTLAALANVIAINFNYDLHAKMYPTVMFVMAVFLLLPQAGRIFRFFFTDQATSLPVIQPHMFRKKWLNVAKVVVKILVIGINLIPLVLWYQSSYREKKEKNTANAGFYGIYDVKEFVVNKDTLSVEDPLRWNQIVFGDRLERVRFKNDSVLFMNVSLSKKEILVYGDQFQLQANKNRINKEQGYDINMDSILVARQLKSLLHFEVSDSAMLHLKGMIKNDSVVITARRRPIEVNDFRLMKRRFHWITEVPYVY